MATIWPDKKGKYPVTKKKAYKGTVVQCGTAHPRIADVWCRLQKDHKGNHAGDEHVWNCKDAVNHPSHYNQGNIECIEAMRACSTKEEFEGHCRLTAFKYVWRLNDKGDSVENAEKAIWYLKEFISSKRGEQSGNKA